MRQQTKPFIVERKSRKSKPAGAKPSIWGRLDLTLPQDPQDEQDRKETMPARADEDHR